MRQLPVFKDGSPLLNVVVDTPKGSRNKYKYDDKYGVFRLSKALPLGASFPFDFGYIPSTRGEDGDPVDVLVLADEPTFPGCVVPALLIGVIEAEQTENKKVMRNDRLSAAIETPFNPPAYRSLDEIDAERLAEIQHFFISYNEMEGRQFHPLGRRGPEQARKLVRQAAINEPAHKNGARSAPVRSHK
jgi:inorganic pyrophosphatase